MSHQMTRLALLIAPFASIALPTSTQSPILAQDASLIELRLVHPTPATGLQQVEYQKDTLYLEPQAVIADLDLVSVRPRLGQDQLLLDLRLKPEAARRLTIVTRENIGKRLALLIASRIRSAPAIQSATTGSSVHAALTLSRDEANAIIELIRARWPAR